MPSRIRRLYEFGPFRLDPQKRVLLRGNDPVSLTPKALETLLVLVENRDRVVLKDDLMKMLWPDSFVEESNLSQNIFMLRKALGDSTQEHRYILTVPGRGYQFTETVNEVGLSDGPQATGPQAVGEDEATRQDEPAIRREEEETLVVATHTRSSVVVSRTEKRGAWLWSGLAVLAVLLVGAGFAYRARHQGPPANPSSNVSLASAVKLRRSVAVLGFRNLSRRAENEWLSTALAEMLRTELAAGDQLRMVPGDLIAQIAHDGSWLEADSLPKDSLAKLRTNLETDYVALGSYTIVGDGAKSHIRLDFRLQDAAAGEIVAQDTVTGNQSDLFDLVVDAGSRMRQYLAVNRISGEQEAQVKASLPANPRAARLYSEGLAKLREFETKAAVDLFTQALAVEPKSAVIHAALGGAWLDLGYDAKATDETRKALALAKNLRSEEQFNIEGQYRRLNHELPKAVEIYRTLTDLYPDNVEYSLRLAHVQELSGASKDAVAILEACRKLPSPLSSDPRIDIVEAQILVQKGDFKKAQEIASQAVQKGKQQHSSIMLAQALHVESQALGWTANYDRALAELAEAKVLYAAAGDLKDSANVLHTGGLIAYEKGSYEDAQRQLQEALVIYQQIGNRQQTARTIETIGNVFYDQGKLTEAKAHYEQALAIDYETGSKIDICSALGNMANVLDSMGDLANAEKKQLEVLRLFREAGDKRGAASTEGNLGNLFVEEGDLARAEENYQLASKHDDETGYKTGTGFVLAGLADVAYRRDDLKTARKTAEKGMTLRKEIGESFQAAVSTLEVAQIALEQGQAVEAEKLASEAVAAFEKANSLDQQATANSVLALALLAEGKSAEAQAAVQQALTQAAKSAYRPPKFDAAIAAARVNLATKKFSEARGQVAPVLAQAAKLGYVPYALEARLLLAEIDLQSGQTTKARAQMAILEKDARAKGFLLLARKASTT